MAITARGREAKTFYKVLEEYGEFLALLECKLESGALTKFVFIWRIWVFR